MLKHLKVSIYVLTASIAFSGTALADSVKVQNRTSYDVLVKTFDGGDSLCWVPLATWWVNSGEDESVDCSFGGKSQCRLLVSTTTTDNSDILDPGTRLCTSGVASQSCGSREVINVQDSQTLQINGLGCEFATPASPGYITGYIYGTNSNANYKCLQAQTDSFANGVDVHVWDKCINGGPQKNRQWKYNTTTGYIHNIDDPSFCLHKATNGYTVGDNIHMWKCDEGPAENKAWEYNFNGQHLIRSKANNNFCIFRGGANVGDAIHLWSCNPNNNIDQNGRWNITWGEGG